MDTPEGLSLVLEHCSGGIVVADLQLHVLYANPAARRLFGNDQLMATRLPLEALAPGGQRLSLPGGQEDVILDLFAKQVTWEGRVAWLIDVHDATRVHELERYVEHHDSLFGVISPLADQALQGASPEQLQEQAAQMVVDYLQCGQSCVLAYDGERSALRPVAGCGGLAEHVAEEGLPLDEQSPIGRCLLEAVPVAIADWQTQADSRERRFFLEHDVNNMLGVPIPRLVGMHTGPWGVLVACAKPRGGFSSLDMRIVQRMAFVLAYAIQHAQLLANERQNSLMLEVTGRVARIGGWDINVRESAVTWSAQACAIHGLDEVAHTLPIRDAGQFIAPESRRQAEQSLQRLLEEGAGFDEEYQIITAQGQRRWIRAIGEPRYDEQADVIGARGAIQDITEQKQGRARLDFLALHDALTKLPNRRSFEERLREEIASCHGSGQRAALLLLDLDDFKAINDTMGHGTGDLLLRQVASRLAAGLRSGDAVARLGGDEFVLIAGHLDADFERAAGQAREYGEALLARLRQPFRLGTHMHECTQSLGIVMFGSDHDRVEELLKQADLAMYQAKGRGRAQACLFDPGMQESIKNRVALEADMCEGLGHGQFVPYLQAQVDVQGHVIGAEALARWFHPQRGMVLPGEFIPVAEASGFIHALGRSMLEQTCLQLAAWAGHADREHLHLAVNVSAQQFHHPDYVREVLHMLDCTGADPHRLVLELTETSVLHNMADTSRKMEQLQKQGVTFSLDDFGTGYSSLYYLRHLPLAQVKIDQSFVRGVDDNPNDAAIVRTILALAGAMELKVIAEGVETESEREFLRRNGCELYQGFLFARPQPMDQFEAMLLGGDGVAAGRRECGAGA